MCILLVFLTYVYHDTRFTERKNRTVYNRGVQIFSVKFHSRHFGIVPSNKGKNHKKNCVTFTLKCNMFERKPVLSGEVCPTADLLPRWFTLQVLVEKGEPSVTVEFSLRYCFVLSRFYCMYVIYKCDHGPQVNNIDDQLNATITISCSLNQLNMFRAIICPSSGAQYCDLQHVV